MLEQYCTSLNPVIEWKDCLVGQNSSFLNIVHKTIYRGGGCFEHLLLLYFLSLKKGYKLDES